MTVPAEVAERYVAAWNSRAFEKVATLWAPGGVEYFPGFGQAFEAPHDLVENLRCWFRAVPDVTWDIASITADDERGIICGTLHGTWHGRYQGITGRGCSFSLMTVDALQVSQGRITHNVCLFDQTNLMRSLGLMPRAGGHADRLLKHAANIVLRLRRTRQQPTSQPIWGWKRDDAVPEAPTADPDPPSR